MSYQYHLGSKEIIIELTAPLAIERGLKHL